VAACVCVCVCVLVGAAGAVVDKCLQDPLHLPPTICWTAVLTRCLAQKLYWLVWSRGPEAVGTRMRAAVDRECPLLCFT
jgi:hypothetical protein